MRLIWKKVLRFVLIALVTTVITFLMVDILPGDIAYIIGGQDATQEDIQAIRKDLGHDRNVLVRYVIWLGHLVQGDFGSSYLTQEPVLSTIFERLPVTLELLIISQLMALLLALPCGIISAYRNGTSVDRLISVGGFATLSIPSFVMALVTIYLFAILLKWLPATGYTPISYGFWANVKSFILPGLSIALVEWVVLMRVLRSDMISTLQQNFILMAKAKGLPAWKVLLHHALRPSSFTLVTLLGLQIGQLIGGTVIIETIFALPGIGRLLVNSIYSRDYMVVQGCILLITIGYVAMNTMVDIIYHVLDPRIRTEPTHVG
jgi:peptide/nickel transport system permease protein